MKKLNLDIQRFSSTNKTTNYELPQFIGTDKPTWLGDFNAAMSTIDSGMHENATDISTMESDVASASAAASQASQDVVALTSTVNTLSTNVSTATTTANNAQSTATSALNTANTANGKADTNASAITTLSGTVTNLSNDFEDSIKYSTTETICGTWENKPLYRRIYSFACGNNAATNTSHGLTNVTIKKILGTATNGTYTITSGYNDEYYANSTHVFWNTKSNRTDFTATIILEYTKTTD